MDNIDETKIEQLVERFMAGETSLEDEDLLYSYFSSNSVSESLKQYKDYFYAFSLFADNDLLCDDNNDTDYGLKSDKIKTDKRPRLFRRFAYAAASVAVLITLLSTPFSNNSLDSIHEGSYVIINNERISDKKLIEKKVEETLAWAEVVEREAELIQSASETETTLINSISDPGLRNEIERLLTD